MLYHTKKILYCSTILGILSLPFNPTYADGEGDNSALSEGLPAEAPPRSRMMALDDYLNKKVQYSVSLVKKLTPDFVANPVSKAFEGTCAWLWNVTKDAASVGAKSIDQIDFENDASFWKAIFWDTVIEATETDSIPDAESLDGLGGIVLKGFISPREFEEGLNDLKKGRSKGIKKRINQVVKRLKDEVRKSPDLVARNFVQDFFIELQDIDDSTGKALKAKMTQFKDLLTYYGALQNSFDHGNQLVAFDQFLLGPITISEQQRSALRQALANATKQLDFKRYETLRDDHEFRLTTLQQLPFYAQDFEKSFNSSLPPVVQESLLKGIAVGAAKLAYQGVKFTIEHPGQALTMVLMAQATAAAAFPQTISLGTQYSASSITPGSQLCDIAPTSTGGAYGIYLDGSYNVVATSLSATAAGSPITLSQTPTTSTATFCIACSPTTDLCAGFWQSGTNMLTQPFKPSGGTLIGTPLTANTIASTSVGGAACAGYSDGSLGFAWASSSVGNDQIWQRTMNQTSAGFSTSPLVVSGTPSVIQGGPCMVGLVGTPSRALLGWQGAATTTSYIYDAVVNTAAGTIQSAAQIIASNTTYLQQNTRCFAYSTGEGGLTWQTGTVAVPVQLIAASGATQGSNYPLQGVSSSGQVGFPAGVGTPDGNALVIVQQNPGGYATGYGGTFNKGGTPQSAFVQIPYNPGNNGQDASRVALLGGGTPSNYTALSLFFSPSAGTLQARPINVQTPTGTTVTTSGTAAPTSGSTSIAPTVSATPTILSTGGTTSSTQRPTGSPAPSSSSFTSTAGPTPTSSAASTLTPSLLMLPFSIAAYVWNAWR